MSAKTELPCWLIRDNRNVIRGPVSHTEIHQLLKKGHLKGKTEICRANMYWFSVDEKAEIAKFFPEGDTGKTAPLPESLTQMTATSNEHKDGGEPATGIDNTQFISAEEKGALPPTQPAVQQEMQWLSDEFADEFGDDFSDHETTVKIDKDSGRISDVNSSAKLDALPSEMKGNIGERPKPINSLIKGPEKSTSTSHTVTVPIAATEAAMKILDPQIEELESARIGRRNRRIFFTLVFTILIGGGIFFYTKFAKKIGNRGHKSGISSEFATKNKLPPHEAIRKSFLLYDLESAKEAISELEQTESERAILPLAQAIFKKEFLFDTDAAISVLQAARGSAGNEEITKELENLGAIYGFERDRAESISAFKKMADNQASALVKYNLSMAYLRAGNYAAAGATAATLLPVVRSNPELSMQANLVIGWAKELGGGSDASAELAFQRALEMKSYSPKAHLGLAINRLRRKGLRESESEFRAFIDSLPQMDGPDQVANFRQMNDFEIYNLARDQIRDLNVPGGSVGSKPSPLIMAVDAVLSCLQNRQGEAGKILEGALSAAPGDITILKAVGYHRWREARYDEIIEFLKDQTKEKNNFALNYLLARAYEKTGKKSLEEKHIQILTENAQNHSATWALAGHFKLRQGDQAGAKAAFEESLEKNSLDLEALRGLDKLGADQLLISAEFKDYLPF